MYLMLNTVSSNVPISFLQHTKMPFGAAPGVYLKINNVLLYCLQHTKMPFGARPGMDLKINNVLLYYL